MNGVLREYKREIMCLDGDYFRLLPTSELIRTALCYIVDTMADEGCERGELFKVQNAVWMISRIRVEQFSHISVGDELCYRVLNRTPSGNKFLMTTEISRGFERVAVMDSMHIAVEFYKRKILPLDIIDPLWKTSADSDLSRYFSRLDTEGEYTPCGVFQAGKSDCDSNRHLTAPRYVSVACERAGFWDGEEPNLMKMFQIDFLREVRPGDKISLFRRDSGGRRLVRGVKERGVPSFTAMCEF